MRKLNDGTEVLSVFDRRPDGYVGALPLVVCTWDSCFAVDAKGVHPTGNKWLLPEEEIVPWESLGEIPVDAWFQESGTGRWGKIIDFETSDDSVGIDGEYWCFKELFDKFTYTLDLPSVLRGESKPLPCGKAKE